MAERRQALFAKRARDHQIRFPPRDIGLAIEGPGNTCVISGLTEHGQALVIERGCGRIFALQLFCVREVAEGAGNVSQIAQVPPDRDAALEERSGIDQLAALPGDAWVSFVVRDGQLVPIKGDTRLRAGDDVLVLAEPGLRDQLITAFEGPSAS